ncbi:1403_t:CDS:10 [Funneliformis geosporum]|uniref:Eukaryotic translation initiation factor 3 subunit D n=1 Tax=Funneliformis geosporum TaxID=1117311 RepID=A0A9W4WUB1_9GLOM|nr:5251_t:CDS:10 [Funneliformis geosporum]CAI2165995.1 1403_t:CDS:10 [Funneliformis geosporum]
MDEPTFQLPEIIDNDNGWGPSPAMLPEKFRDIPFAPYSKADKLGKIADWSTPEQKEKESSGRQRANYRNYRDQYTAYGYGVSSAFVYTHAEDEASFSVVDNRSTAQKKASSYRAAGGTKGRTGARGQASRNVRNGQFQRYGNQNRNSPGNRSNPTAARRRYGWKDYDKPQRARDASVKVGPEWKVLEEIEFSRLSKLNLDVDDGEDLSSHGYLYFYDKNYDLVRTKSEKSLLPNEKVRFFITTSKDPIIEQLAKDNEATVFATDSILSLLMCAPRSVYPWDIVINRIGNKLFFDKRSNGVYDYITVNENSADPPLETGDKDNINAPTALALEATLINHHFALQVVNEDEKHEFEKPNPFINSPEDAEEMAPCAYRYRKFDLSINEDEDVSIIVRTQLDSAIKSPTGGVSFLTIKALNEFDPRAQGAGGALDWRQKLDTQRGAVVTTEMKNNSCKLARWAVQSILAGADQMKLGYVSRVSPKDNQKHVILGTQMYKPRDFTAQMNLSVSNGWGIVRTIVDLCMKLPEGRYVLIKDPNKPLIRLYGVPANTFDAEDDLALDDGDELEEEEEENLEKPVITNDII